MTKNEPISEQLREHYARRFAEHGATSEGVDWGPDEARMLLRYEKMLALLRPGQAPVSLLDVGCGFGGLRRFAAERGHELDYTGIDVADTLVAWARENQDGGTYEVADVLEYAPGRRFDYVVCNGILTQKLGAPGLEMDRYAGRVIRRLFELCEVGAAFNVMSTKVNFFADNLYYRNPAELLAWCLTELTPSVRLDHAYPLYEYTLYLYREPDSLERPAPDETEPL